MASTDGANPVQQSLKEEHLDATQTGLTTAGDNAPPSHGAPKSGQDANERPGGEGSPVPSSPASGISTTKGGTQPPSTSGQTHPPPLSMPHPKKFSHVNINKKFLEKTSASTPSHTHPASPVTKTPSTAQKPVLQTSTSHPRLVTAKLTATPQPSTTTGPGWSRPSSAVPSTTPTPLPSGNGKPTSSPAAASGIIPLPPPGGKVIQPQPRSAQDAVPPKKDIANKPAWGNAKSTPLNAPKPVGVQKEFPTAAEVAQGRISTKQPEQNGGQDAAAVHKQAVMAELQAEEDTFRGVHLDPNAHHWDEMEEDDDNFLGGVIEFEDGRQYKVQSTEGPQQHHAQEPATQGPSHATDAPVHSGLTDQPVSKEERFADDFDRSWPRSGPSHRVLGHPRDQRPDGLPISPSASSHSPQETSRVLFNERSNRLEPYSHQRSAPAAPFNRRGGRPDPMTSPIEPRRDAPPHTHLQGGVQLLQKGARADGTQFSRTPGDRSSAFPQDALRFRDRQSSQRDHTRWQGNGPHGHDRDFSATGYPHPSRDAPFEDRVRRPPGFEPPSGSDSRRQVPPHLSAVGPGHPPSMRMDGPTQPQPTAPHVPVTVQQEAAPPSSSSQAAISPAITDKALPTSGASAIDEEEARKAAMHEAAERARLRRQQEEEQREKERERARQKAAELEAKMKAMEEEKAREREKIETEKKRAEAEAVGFIEQAVSSSPTVENKAITADRAPQQTHEVRPPLVRDASARGTTRPFTARRPSFTPSNPAHGPVHPSPASEADSWRRKAPLHTAVASAVPSDSEAQKSTVKSVMSLPILAHAGLELKAGEEVEVVDFSDHGKLVVSEIKASSTAPRPSRAIASDFFGDSPQRSRPPLSRGDEPWRRSSHTAQEKSLTSVTSEEVNRPGQAVDHDLQTTTGSQPPMHDDHSRRVSSHLQNGVHRPLTGPSYREASMSALDDAMSRIKGAIDVMHNEAEPPKAKWLPPALRPKPAHADFAPPQEVFDVTSAEPPKSPKPAWNIFHVNLPRVTRPVGPPPQTELVWPRGQRQPRLDVYSFNPPIDVLHRRDSTVNDILFNRPRIQRGQPKYFVSLPRRRVTRRRPSVVAETSTSPIVNLPSTPTRLRNPTLPKETASATAPSWRKAPPSPTASWRTGREDVQAAAELDTVSRSPPPEVPPASSTLTSVRRASESVPASTTAVPQSSRPKAEPKLSMGSDVAFYRNAPVEAAVEPKPTMQFIVSSELESESQSDARESTETKGILPQESRVVGAPVGASGETAEQKRPTTLGSINGATTPPPQPHPSLSPWKSPKPFSTKESPARAPDPEHLKAVWSQTADKAQIQPVNSLKGIADDLTGVPFTLQDVKSDDGETPPPSSSGPWSRMSSYEVTRAFQQVPSPSSSSSQRPAPIAPSSSSSTNGSAPRHPGFAISPPPMGQPAFRPAYPPYPPMASHSPSPTIMYGHPSPVPRHMVMNGNSPAYSQAVWVPNMPGAAPPPSSTMVRSPYPAHVMPYPPGGAVPMYAAPMPMQNQPPQNGAQGRPPSMAMMSPAMPPAMSPMYAGSPVLVPAAPVMTPGQGYPLQSPASRAPGPMRPYEQSSMNGTHMHPSPMRQPPQNGYHPVPSNYARLPW
ncbi:hypothetical protein C8Q73DRAFT_734645 [Cubamyces lactineus]|nr:hypothetical protein C8Q73DRAFT_734645 [Cubamyces lactineus]